MHSDRPRKVALVAGLLLIAVDLCFALFSGNSQSSKAEIQASKIAEPLSRVMPYSERVELVEKTTTEKSKSDLSPVEIELCNIRKKSSVPLDGELRIQSSSNGRGGKNLWLKSSLCPDELYSVVTLDDSGRIEKEISCMNTSLTEVTLNSRLQFDVNTVVPDAKFRSVALSGPGRLLVNCLDDRLTLTRDGRFNQESGNLVNPEGCTAWTRKNGGRALRFAKDEQLDKSGCSLSTGECLEILEFDASDTDAFNFRTKNSLTILNDRGLRAARATDLVENALEDLDSLDRSLTGVASWETLPITVLPAHCP